MKIKIKYEIQDSDGASKKTYSKTFSQVNENSQKENFEMFANAYLSLVEGNNQAIKYIVTKTNEEEIASGNLL